MLGPGELAAGIIGSAAVALTAVSVPFVSPALRRHCIPYVPASPAQIANVVASVTKAGVVGRVVDLGSGDGRVLFAVARAIPRLKCTGVELNYPLVLFSRFDARKNALHRRVDFLRRDLWKMQPFATHLASQQYEGVVLACRFPLPQLKADRTVGEGLDAVWTYDLRKSNSW